MKKKKICLLTSIMFLTLITGCVKTKTSVKEETTKAITQQETKEIIEVVHDKEETKISNYVIDEITSYPVVDFGSYYLSKSSIGPIKWLVVDNNADYSLLVSKNVIDCRNYSDTDNKTTWNDSALKKWLNTDFANIAFGEIDLNKLVDLSVYTSQNGKVSLLSLELCNTYFGKNNMDAMLQAIATNYAIEKGVEISKNTNTKTSSYYLIDTVENTDEADKVDKAMWVGQQGHIYIKGQAKKLMNGDGIRPIICVKNSVYNSNVLQNIRSIFITGDAYAKQNELQQAEIENTTKEQIAEIETSVETIETYEESASETGANIEIPQTTKMQETTKPISETTAIKETVVPISITESTLEKVTYEPQQLSGRYKSTTVPLLIEDVIDAKGGWSYGRTPLQWIYVEANKQIISNNKPNNSPSYGYKGAVSSGEKGCFVPIFFSCDAVGSDYEGRFYCYEDNTKNAPTDMTWAGKFSDIQYGAFNVLELLQQKYNINVEKNNILSADGKYINIIYVTELDEIISALGY